MVYDEQLAARIRAEIGSLPGFSEKKMFGGVGIMLNGNMCCGVHGDGMIVRLSPEQAEAALHQAHTRLFDLPGRPMKGWIVVQPEGLGTELALARWVQMAVQFASTLPAKK